MRKNKLSQIVILAALGLILLVAWFKIIDLETLKQYLHQIKIWWAITALAMYAIAYFVRSIRWRLLLGNVYKGSVFEVWNYYMGGMLVNYIIPIRLGEVSKSLLLKKNHDVPISKSLPTVFIDKLFDLLPIVFLIVLSPFLPVPLNFTVKLIMAVLFIIFFIFGFILFLSLKNSGKTARMLSKIQYVLPRKVRPRFANFSDKFVSNLAVIRNVSIISLIALTIISVSIEALYFLFMFKAFGSTISYMTVFFGYTLVNLSYILPTPPLQAGSLEFVIYLVFVIAFAQGKDLITSMITFAHAITGLLIFVLGFVSLFLSGVSFKDLLSTKEN